MVEPFDLSDDELQEASDVVRRSSPGVYTVAKLYGPGWVAKDSPTTFGGRFKAAVAAGRSPGISVHPEKTGANATQHVVPITRARRSGRRFI